ncbi:MAG: hypothetical protein ACJ786_31385 [Catenulispora sp.]
MAGISGVSAGIVLAGRYTLSRRLWHRGIGELWLASDSVRRRRVWIQVSASGGLENAVSALTRVQHPAIAVVREAGQKRIAHEDRVVTDHDSHSHKLIHKSDSYIEFAVYDQDKGSSLTARLMKGALTSAELATIALSVAEVFETVHAAGLVHGWLHTDSVWLGSKGSVFVDLALGLAFEGDAATLVGEAEFGFVTAGRLGGGSISAADDVYALSWLLYVCIFGWEIVREDLERARAEAAGVAVGLGGSVGVGAAAGAEGLIALLAFRREIAVGRIIEFFGEGSELAVLFANCLSGEVGARPSMTEVVTVLRGRQEAVAALAVPVIVAERAAAAGVALGVLAEAEALGASVEEADSGTWTPSVSPTAGGSKKGMITLAEAEAATAAAVALALAEAEAAHRAELDAARSEHEAAVEVAAAAAMMAEAEGEVRAERRAAVGRSVAMEAAGATAVALAVAEVEERSRLERQAAEANQAAAIEAASAAAVALAVAEVEERFRVEREAAEANRATAIEAACAAAVVVALAEAATAHAAELEAAKAEAAREATAAAGASQAAAIEAASAAAVALAVAEVEERFRAEREAAATRQAAAIEAAGAAAVAVALAEAAAAAGANTQQLPAPASAAGAAHSSSPKAKPWLVASGGAVIGIAVGIGLGYASHGSSSPSPTAGPTNGVTMGNTGAVPVGVSSSVSPSAPVPSAATAGSATVTVTETATAAAASAPSSTPESGAGIPATPASSATTPASPATPATPATPGSGPSTPEQPHPTSPQQAESRVSSIIAAQIPNAAAAGALNHSLSQLKAAPVGSNGFTEALASLNGLITSELHQGAVSPNTAEALRQQLTYLLSFSGS